MAKVRFKRINTASQIDNVPIEDGSFIITGDGKSYIDYGLNRVPTNGTLDTEMSDTSRNAVENKVIKEYVDDSKQEAIDYGKPVVLWTNPSPNSNFGAQDITLSSGDYSYLEIYYYDWNDSNVDYKNVLCQKIPKGYNTTLNNMFNYSGQVYAGLRRCTYINNTKYNIQGCYTVIDGNRYAANINNAWCVPVKILGYK